MKIALIGYGKMGKEIESVARDRKVQIETIFNTKNNFSAAGLTKESLKNVDVCIDFSTPGVVVENIEAVAQAGKNIIVGTTGWYESLPEITKLVKTRKIGLLYCPNFSLGINLFTQLAMTAARIIDRYDLYDIAISEIHHREKADSPSGTALALANIFTQQVHRKKEIFHETAHEKIKPGELHVTSTRLGYVVGKHSIMFDSDADTIELVHTAKNRRGFALGALIAAEWIKGKKGVFTMKDVLVA